MKSVILSFACSRRSLGQDPSVPLGRPQGQTTSVETAVFIVSVVEGFLSVHTLLCHSPHQTVRLFTPLESWDVTALIWTHFHIHRKLRSLTFRGKLCRPEVVNVVPPGLPFIRHSLLCLHKPCEVEFLFLFPLPRCIVSLENYPVT